jgi:hypothetical protein
MAEIPFIQRIISVLWPSFLTAGVATGLFFTAFDPHDLTTLLGLQDASRIGVYSVGFFLFWLLTASSCLLTCYFQRPCSLQKGA